MMNLIDTHFHLDYRTKTVYNLCNKFTWCFLDVQKSNYRDKIFKVCYRLSSAGVDIR